MSAAEPARPITPEAPGFFGWVAILAGVLPFMILWATLTPLWVAALTFVAWGRRQAQLPYALLLLATLFSVVPGIWLYTSQRDAIGGFGSFLVLATCVVLAGAKRRVEHRVPYLLSFILLMAVGHRTLEIFYMLPVTLFFLGYTLARMGEEAKGPVPRGRAATLLLLATAILSVPFFLFMPRTRMSVMALASRANLSGFAGSIRFGQMGEMKLSDRVVMRVQTRSPAYLRGLILDAYDRSGWRNTYRGTRTISPRASPLLVVEEELVGAGKLVDTDPAMADAEGRPPVPPGGDVYVQDVMLESFEEASLFASGRVLAVWAPGQNMAVTVPGDLIRLEHDARNEKLLYRVYSRRIPDPADLPPSAPFGMRGGFQRRYLQLPEGLPTRVRARAEELTRGQTTVHGKAVAVQRYLQENFLYSLSRNVDFGADPVDDLLFGDPRGHCEYFASAMAVMLRAVGVHTRVCIGFAPGDYNKYADSFTVRDRDAHAWVEVYLGEEQDWVTYDPTPSDPDHEAGDEAGSDLYLMLSAGLDQVDAWWQNEVVNYYYNEGGRGAETWLDLLDDFMVNDLGMSWLRYPPADLMSRLAKGAATLVGLVLGALAVRRLGGLGATLALLLSLLGRLLAGLKLPRLPWGRTPRHGPGTSGEAGRLYAAWLDLEARAGRARDPSDTPREFLARIQARAPERAAAAGALTRAYEAEVYAERVSPTQLEAAREALVSLRRAAAG